MKAALMIAIVASLVYPTLSLTCYKCDTCGHKVHKKYIKPCPEPNYEGTNETFSCILHIFEDTPRKQIYYFRKCMVKYKADDLCTRERPDARPISCIVCEEDECNGDAPEAAPPKPRGTANLNRPFAVTIIFVFVLTRLVVSGILVS